MYADLIAEELAEARQRRGTLEQRALHVISTCAALIALVVAIAVLARSEALQASGIGSWAGTGMTAALAFLVASALAASRGIQVGGYAEADPAELARLVDQTGQSGQDAIAGTGVAELRSGLLVDTRRGNHELARWLRWAIGLEAGGAVALALAGAAVIAGQ